MLLILPGRAGRFEGLQERSRWTLVLGGGAKVSTLFIENLSAVPSLYH